MPIFETKVFYYVVLKGMVTATVYLGDGQVGGWAIVRGGSVLAKGSGPKGVEVGPGTELRGSHIVMSANVRDMSDESDRLSVTTVLEGGRKEEEFSHDRNGEPGESAVYTSVIVFQ